MYMEAVKGVLYLNTIVRNRALGILILFNAKNELFNKRVFRMWNVTPLHILDNYFLNSINFSNRTVGEPRK